MCFLEHFFSFFFEKKSMKSFMLIFKLYKSSNFNIYFKCRLFPSYYSLNGNGGGDNNASGVLTKLKIEHLNVSYLILEDYCLRKKNLHFIDLIH